VSMSVRWKVGLFFFSLELRESWLNIEIMIFWRPFFLKKSCLFFRIEMDNLPSNFSDNTMQCISIEQYLERSNSMMYATVNATGRPQKATNWSGIKNGKSSKEIRLPWYQSINKEYFWVYVKFEVGSSIPFTKKLGSKKRETFSKVYPFFKWRGLKL
jgi:hypothetical protein